MHQRKSKKILIYFFLLFIFGSLNNVNFNKIKFNKIENINILETSTFDSKILLNKIKSLNLENIFLIKPKLSKL